ncbi:hypothetical protein QUG02_27550 [Bacillus hominis]|uniref:Uncharacterized protein n=2 Tax=Bacillus cereus group TaxID=86661 RepID=A0A2A9Q237_BACCE|nr:MULTISPECIES: hypothetical protein [Bacillus cereus group]MDM5436274.1 hypothetical protein [Bacillus hominis]MDM5441771.1 hypothetical protein [Bacillus hominis]MED0993407.1 hypothetical protein [Bacillus nitratireducens]PEB83261.1 hypothetical protein COM95_02180 [Bacillus cereus]PEC19191.1 hypothetical protein COM96_26440 [Bacillus cereus]
MGNIVEIVDIDYKGVWAEKEDQTELIFISLSKKEIQAVRKMLSEQKPLYVFLQKDLEWKVMS